MRRRRQQYLFPGIASSGQPSLHVFLLNKRISAFQHQLRPDFPRPVFLKPAVPGSGFLRRKYHFLTYTAAAPGSQPDIADSHGDACLAVFIRNQGCRREKFRHIQYLHSDPRPPHRPSRRVLYRNCKPAGLRIGGGFIQIVHPVFPADPFLLHAAAVIIAEASAVYQDCPSRRAGKPSPIQLLLRLTGAKEMPPAVNINLHPGMIIITVRPPGRIDLPGGNSHAAAGSRRKGGFLAAPSFSAAVHGHGGSGSAIRRLISCMLRAPVIDFPDCFLEGKPGNPVLQPLIKKRSAVADILGINAVIKHVMDENILGQPSAPLHIVTQPQRMPYIG